MESRYMRDDKIMTDVTRTQLPRCRVPWYNMDPRLQTHDTAAQSRCRDGEAGYFIGIPDTVDTTRIANVSCEQRSH